MSKTGLRRQRRRGVTAVETSLVISICLLLVFGIFEYGRYLMISNLMEVAAQAGARYAVVHTHDVTTAQIQDKVDQILAGQSVHLQGYNKTTSIKVYWADANGNNLGAWTDARFGEYVAIRIDGTYQPMLPNLLFMNPTIPMRTHVQMYSEAN